MVPVHVRTLSLSIPNPTVDGSVRTYAFERVSPGFNFSEAIPSWNVDSPGAAQVEIRLRARAGDHLTKPYVLGQWRLDLAGGSRVSVDGQKDADGTVLTDTLRLVQPTESLDIEVSISGDASAKLKRLFINFWSPGEVALPVATQPISPIEVPQKAQGNYPNGGVMCSPTTTTMLLNYWSVMQNRMDLYVDVPDTIAAVWDDVYKGAGNWPFNMAFAGSFPGMVAYVSRLSSTAELCAWLKKRVPVACSVAFSLLNGKPLDPKEAGHLVVLVGFDANGDPIFNDPARRAQVRRTYKLADFEAAWSHSKRTVYLIYPEGWPTP